MARIPLLAASLVLALTGCAREPTTAAITAPEDGDVVVPAADGTVEISFDTGFFRYEPPGECTYTRQCGQAFLYVDGDACNGPDGPYNAAGPAPGSPNGRVRSLFADFTLCPSITGDHEMTIELVSEDGTVEVTTSITVTVDIPPGISFTSPAPGDTIMVGADVDQSFDVEFEVVGLTLMAPGSCAGIERCGHVEVRIDGFVCDEPGLAANAEGTSSPIEAHFARCPSPLGLHEIEIALHDDDHSPVGGDGTSASVVVTAE